MELINQLTTFLRGLAVFTLLTLNPNSVSIPSPTPSPSTSPEPTPITQNFDPSPSTPIPTDAPQLAPAQQPAGPSYELLPHPSGEEGFYVLKNTPDEPMASAQEVNLAVNQYRQAHGLNQLSIDPQLCDIAQIRASEAATHFSHQEFQQHIEAGDYNHTGFQSIGENLWQGSFSGVHIVEFGWDRSPGHRANLQGDWSRGCAGIHHTTVAFIFAK